MSLKQYQVIKIFLVFITAFIYSQTALKGIILIPIGVMITSALLLLFLRKRVKEIITDERDRLVVGSAAFLAMQIYCWASAILMFILYSLRKDNQLFEIVGLTLAYSTCALIVLYALIFKLKIKTS